jgi:hypothetical protein
LQLPSNNVALVFDESLEKSFRQHTFSLSVPLS